IPSIDLFSEIMFNNWLHTFLTLLLSLLLFLLRTVFWTVFLSFFAIWWLQPHFLYLPTVHSRAAEKRQIKYNPRGSKLPSEHNLPYEEYFIRTSDGVMLHSWLIAQNNRHECPTIIYFHGNAGSKYIYI